MSQYFLFPFKLSYLLAILLYFNVVIARSAMGSLKKKKIVPKSFDALVTEVTLAFV